MANNNSVMDELKKILPEQVNLDADTVKDAEGSVRYEHLNAPEVPHMTEEGMTHGEHGGQFYADLYENLSKEAGFEQIYRTGKQGYYGRDLGGKKDEYGAIWQDKLMFEGLATPTDAHSQEIYDMGIFARAFQKEVGGEEDSIWEEARQKQEAYNKATTLPYTKQFALNERQLQQYNNIYGSSYSPFYQNDVQYRHYDRDLENQANSNFAAGWNVGWGSIKESAAQGLAWLGDVFDSEDLYKYGTAVAEEVAYENSKFPEFANDIEEVEWSNNLKGFGDWLAGISGVALPYMLGLIGTAVTGGVIAGTAPVWGTTGATIASLFGTTTAWAPGLWIYAGESYGNMSGDMDQKSAGWAFSAGFAMIWLDRLGLSKLVSASTALKQDGMKQVAKVYAKENNMTEEAALKAITDSAGNLAKDALVDVSTIAALQMNKATLAKSVGKRFFVGAGIEGGTEFLQESAGYLAGHLGTDADIRGTFDWDEYNRIAINATAGGIFLGGGIAGTTSTYKNISGFKRLQREVSPVAEDKDYIGNTLENNMDEVLSDFDVDGNIDVEKSSKENYEKGAKQDLSKTRGGEKTLWQNMKEFPARFTKKVGSFWQDRVMKSLNDKQSKRGKKAFAVLQTVAGMGKTVWMQGLDLINRKRLLQRGLVHELDTVEKKLHQLLGVGLRGMSTKQANEIFIQYLQDKADGKPMDSKYAQFEKELEQLRKDIGGQEAGFEYNKGVTDKLYNMVKGLLRGEGDTDISYMPKWFQNSRRLNVSEVLKDKNGFIKILMEKDGWSKADAEEFYEFLESGPVGYDKSQLKELGFLNTPSRSLKQSGGVLKRIFGDDSKFLENDPFQRARENIQEQINYAADRRYIGKDGEKLKKLLLIVEEEMGADWDPRMFTHYLDSVAASRGDYRRMDSKTAERMVGHITFFNTFAHLDLSMLASLPEMAIVLLGATRDKRLLELFQTGVNDFARKYARESQDMWSYINPKSGVTREEYTRNLADFYRYGYGTSTHGAIGQVGIDESIYKASKIKEFVMKAFFTANLLKIYTDTTRVARLALANDAIFGDLEIIGMYPPGHVNRNSGLFHDAFERMRELQIDPDLAAKQYTDIVGRARAKLNIGHTADDLYVALLEENPSFMETMDVARMTWIDNSIAHPDAMNRPLWYSNPYYRLFTQYNGFMSVFTAHLLPKIWKRIKGQDPTAKYATVAIAATMLMLGFLSQAMKDEWRYGGRPGWLTDRGYVQRGVTSSGLIGTPEKILSAISPIYDVSKKPWESRTENLLKRGSKALEDLAGPTYAHGEQILKMITAHLEGDLNLRNIYLTREIPFFGKAEAFKDYNLGRGSVDLETAWKRATPF